METLKTTEVRDIIESIGAESATITVLKGNGTTRSITGVFKPTSGFELDETLQKEGRIPIYCLAENAWKSFKENRVLAIS
ncbi:MAG: hypothetical protein COB84_02020 [Rhodobacteraceae bacterium]|nr:MAG: hypothetical protein COB84_02020 [Paracoccaceae bacterium]